MNTKIEFSIVTQPLKRFHVHGLVNSDDESDGAAVSVSVDAESDEHAQKIAWLACPGLDVQEIDQA